MNKIKLMPIFKEATLTNKNKDKYQKPLNSIDYFKKQFKFKILQSESR
jgi:hypothetical protein